MKIETRKKLTFLIILSLLSTLTYICIFNLAKTQIKLYVVPGSCGIQHKTYL